MENLNNTDKTSENAEKELRISDVISSYENKVTRPLKFEELCLILTRFQIMLEEKPDRYTIEEFIQQEDFRRDMFS
jgi:hypothetical protein